MAEDEKAITRNKIRSNQHDTALPPANYPPPTLIQPIHLIPLSLSSRECLTDAFRRGIGVVVHGGIPESRPELFSSSTAMLVEDLYTLGHLHHDQAKLA